MAKFETTTKDFTRDEIVAMVKANKLPPAKKSSCPFTDGMKVKFEKFQVVEWTNGSNKGQFLTIMFEGNDNPFALSMLFKSTFGFDTAKEAYEEENLKEFSNTGGLYDKLKGFANLSEDFLKEVEKFFGNKEKTIRLTPFYVKDRYGRVALHNLCNII